MDVPTLALPDIFTARISPRPPFSFRGTFCKPSHYPTPDLSFEGETYRQTLRFQGNLYGLKICSLGDEAHPCLQVQVFYDQRQNPDPDFEAILAEIAYRFDLQAGLAPFVNAFQDDPILGTALARWPGMRVSTAYSFYEFTVITAVLQNTVVRRSVQMMNNLFNAYGTRLRFDEQELFGFWDSRRFTSDTEEELRALKLGYRAKTLLRQANAFLTLDVERLRAVTDTGRLKKELLSIYGIGPATVQYILFEVFHHYDACDHIPPWEQKIYSRLLFERELVDTDVLLSEIERRWGSWKMLAMHYIFEDLFWQRKYENVPWLEALIRL